MMHLQGTNQPANSGRITGQGPTSDEREPTSPPTSPPREETSHAGTPGYTHLQKTDVTVSSQDSEAELAAQMSELSKWVTSGLTDPSFTHCADPSPFGVETMDGSSSWPPRSPERNQDPMPLSQTGNASFVLESNRGTTTPVLGSPSATRRPDSYSRLSKLQRDVILYIQNAEPPPSRYPNLRRGQDDEDDWEGVHKNLIVRQIKVRHRVSSIDVE
jgi:hypothetical protein